MRKRLLIFLLFMVLSPACARAEVLGDMTDGWITYMGALTYFHNSQFYSQSVGKQTENYVEYTPNTEAVPVVVNGYSIWGTRNITQAEQYMKDNGLRPLMGINGDYFSFKTGIPMGHTIVDGEIVSKEHGGQDAVGFRADGTGFIRWLDLSTTLSDGNRSIDIMYVNKWCQPQFDPVYLLTDKFGDSTQTSSDCIFVICTPESGSMRVDETMKLRVDDIFIYNGAIEIPDGKMVFVMDTSGTAECYDFLSRLAKGQELTLTNTAVGDDGTWKSAENGLSTVGGRLIKDGVVNTSFEAGSAPRTAVGIKADGNIIFYTLDGRQFGHSYGAQLKTLAYRMSELGCVDAINLDGGGSTTISAWFPGMDASMIVNSPSDGYARKVANFLFLKDNREKTGKPWIVNLKEAGNTNYLSGMSAKVEIESVYDTGNYKMDSYDIDFRVDTATQSTIDSDGNLSLAGTGDVNVVLYDDNGDLTSRMYGVYENPEEIKVYNQADWREISEIYTEANEELQLNLSAASYINNTELISDNNQYTWEIEGDIGTITKNGIFTLADAVNIDGKIKVSFGSCVKEIPVHIADYPKTPNPFYDTEGHWARDVIAEMAATGVINGLEEDGRMVFRPDNNMTRAEFAAMIVNYKQLDMSKYGDVTLDFADTADIPPWAVPYIKAVKSEGIILGQANDDGTVAFSPYSNITRADAMTILGRILEDVTASAPLDFADAADIPEWSKDGIGKLLTLGIVTGYEDNTILPNNNIKRAEAAALIYKAENRQ